MSVDFEMHQDGPPTPAVDSILSKPVWLARFLNLVINWTEMYCSGGCGYPITGRYSVELERVGKTPIKFYVCGVATECAKSIERLEMHDQSGARYSEVRPALIDLLKSNEDFDDFGVFLSR